MLQASVAVGESGPVITLSGETDLTTVARLSALISRQLPAGTVELTIDVSGLRFADSASIRALVLAARTLHERGGRLVLLTPSAPWPRCWRCWARTRYLRSGADCGRARG